ncbi:MAG: YdeI/OmpD-associated family protein [Sphingobacteriales bacterium]
MGSPAQQLKDVDCKNRAVLRKWLEKNHRQKESVWLILHKKNSLSGNLTYKDALEEGLCFGWIDSKTSKLNDETYKLLYSPRKPKSAWSKVNKAKIEKLINDGLIHPAGLAKIEAAKKDRSWNALDSIEEFKLPAELEKALNKNKTAKNYFEAFPPGVRKQIMWWIETAKQSETKQKHVKETVELAAKNIRANQYLPKLGLKS